jgi:hypothetical protein
MSHERSGNARGESVKRIIIYSILALLISVAQCSLFSSLDICPATPDLILGLVIAAAMLDSVRPAMVIGISAGFLCDALCHSGDRSFSALFYLLAVLLLGTLAEKMLPRFYSWLCLMAIGLILRAAYTAVLACIAIRALPAPSILLSAILPELAVTAILCLPIYPIVRLCVKPIKAHSRFSF